MRLLLAIAVLTSTPAHAILPDPPSAPAANKATPQAARTLAELMTPRHILTASQLAIFDKNAASGLRQSKDISDADLDSPGLIDEMVRAMRPLTEQSVAASIDRVHPLVAKLLGSRLSPREIAELIDFYRSELGQRVVSGMASGGSDAAAAAAFHGQLASAETKVNAEDVRKDLARSANALVAQLTPVQERQIEAFMKTAAYAALERINPELEAIMLAELNREDPQFDAAVESAMNAIMARRFPETKK